MDLLYPHTKIIIKESNEYSPIELLFDKSIVVPNTIFIPIKLTNPIKDEIIGITDSDSKYIHHNTIDTIEIGRDKYLYHIISNPLVLPTHNTYKYRELLPEYNYTYQYAHFEAPEYEANMIEFTRPNKYEVGDIIAMQHIHMNEDYVIDECNYLLIPSNSESVDCNYHIYDLKLRRIIPDEVDDTFEYKNMKIFYEQVDKEYYL